MEQEYKILLNISKSENSYRMLYCSDNYLRYEDKTTNNIIDTIKMKKEDLEELKKINEEINRKFEKTKKIQNEFSTLKISSRLR